jgi:hypothetical protein
MDAHRARILSALLQVAVLTQCASRDGSLAARDKRTAGLVRRLFAAAISAIALLHAICGGWVMQQLRWAAKEVAAAEAVADAVAEAVAAAAP